MKNITHQYVVFAIGIATMILINFFLNGKIIDIPKGTREGGIISVIGYVIIIVIMAVLLFGILLLINRKKNNHK